MICDYTIGEIFWSTVFALVLFYVLNFTGNTDKPNQSDKRYPYFIRIDVVDDKVVGYSYNESPH